MHLRIQVPAFDRRPKRRVVSLRPVRPSASVEVGYAARLATIAAHLDRVGTDLVTGQRDNWVTPEGRLRVSDAKPPEFSELLYRAKQKFAGIGGVAAKYARDIVAKMRVDVDGRVAQEIQPVIGLDLSEAFAADGELGPAMARALTENIELIKSIPEQYFDLLEEAVAEHWTQGLRWESLSARIAEIGRITRARALFIARDQTSKINARFNEARQTSVGIEEYDWDDSHDKRVRKSHLAMRGRRCRWDSPPLVDGENVHPGEAIGCRCVPRPRFDTAKATGAAAEAIEERAAA